MVKKNSGLDSRNSLIIKIALFLNFLSKDDYNNLMISIKKNADNKNIDVLKIMLSKNYIVRQDLIQLKKTCLSFAKVQEDTRFGALCIEFDFITQSNLNLALEEQQRLSARGENVRIGDLLVDAGMVSERQTKLVLQKQKIENINRKDRPCGDLSKPDSQPNPANGEPEFDTSNMREIREPEIVFLIQNDGLKAYMKKTDSFDPGMLVEDLKYLLEKIGIIYGLAGDDDLTNFIQLPKYKDTVFEVARGLEPIDGTDAKVIFMFERDYLKAGNLAKDGTIDFKDRGDIPFVDQGDVLAEKIPPKQGKDGVNVYGDAIPPIKAMDLSFNIGKGVYLSRDELKVIASAEGNPKQKQSGEISVNSAYFIEGDVDYNTGHIKFDKNVYITGTIKSGFRVEAIDVVANTIDGGIVDAQGDVFVQNGVTESSIKARGNIKAGFIHRSKAMCMGDLSVAKEIVDTEILIEGTFDMTRGMAYSSVICAKGGAKFFSIGSEKAKSSQITVGTSLYLEKELNHIDTTIERRQNILEKSTIEKNKIDSALTVIKDKLKNFDQSRQRTLSMMKEMEKAKDPGKVDLFQKSLDEAEQKIHDLSDRKILLETQIKKFKKDIASNAEAVKISVKDKFTLKRLDQANPPKPILEVSGKAFAGTKVSGKHSLLILNENISRSRIIEMDNNSSENARSSWEMIITNL